MTVEQLYELFQVIPLKQNKAPACQKWRQYEKTKYPFKKLAHVDGYGVICGCNGLEVIDIDNHFGDAKKLLEMVNNHYDIKPFPIVKTQSGGYHIYFKSDKPGSNQKFAMRVNDKGRKETLIESRGVGGYVAAPPMKGYKLLSGSFEKIPFLKTEERNLLLDICRALDEIDEDPEKKSATNSEWKGETSGDAYLNDPNAVHETKALLKENGWKSKDGKHWTRPGKKEKDGISATFQKKGLNKFYVFSSNAHPFNTGSHTMFGIRAQLMHNGDLKECAKELGTRYNKKVSKEKKNSKEKKPKTDPEDEVGRYVRIGTVYYKKITAVDAKMMTYRELEKWKREAIVDDHGKHVLLHILKYDRFCNVPDNLTFRDAIGSNYNLYKDHIIKPKKGKFPTIEAFVKHIFGGQKDMGYDYLQIMYLEPLHLLPILCLISTENQTGKTTFGNFLNIMFGENFASIGSSELKTDFNKSYATRLACMIDESYIDYRIIDKLKQLSTAETIMLRAMHTDHKKIPFFCNFIIASNREEDFIIANKDDVRYWIKKLTKNFVFMPDFLDKLKSEMPAFLYFLKNRPLSTKRESRAHFNPDLIWSAELEKVVAESMKKEYKEIMEVLLAEMENLEVDKIEASPKDIKNQWFDRNYMITFNWIKKFLVSEMELVPEKSPTKYMFPPQKHDPLDIKNRTGRFYTIRLNDLKKLARVEYDGVKVEDCAF